MIRSELDKLPSLVQGFAACIQAGFDERSVVPRLAGCGVNEIASHIEMAAAVTLTAEWHGPRDSFSNMHPNTQKYQ